MNNLTVLPTSELKPTAPRKGRGRKRSSLQRAADLAAIERLALRGLSHAEIAEKIGKSRGYTLSRQIVTYDLARVRSRYENAALESFAMQRAKANRKLDLAEREAWSAYDLSVVRKKPDMGCIDLVLRIHDRRTKLAGLEAPSRLELSGNGGGAIQIEASPGPIDDARRVEILKRHLARLEQAQAEKPAAITTQATG
jgi:hypothetical protein